MRLGPRTSAFAFAFARVASRNDATSHRTTPRPVGGRGGGRMRVRVRGVFLSHDSRIDTHSCTECPNVRILHIPTRCICAYSMCEYVCMMMYECYVCMMYDALCV
jgi:hypothetical protein